MGKEELEETSAQCRREPVIVEAGLQPVPRYNGVGLSHPDLSLQFGR